MADFYEAELPSHLRSMPRQPPKQLDEALTRLGYRGQSAARRALALTAYRHVERLRRIHVDGYDRADLPARTNVLCMGPTGCGKTFIVELLFGRVLHLPHAVVDITGYSETGYVGGDVHSIPTRLVEAAMGNVDVARGGVIVLDEFDKLATSENRAVFAGAETTKDVSGRGVQRELLKMIEGGLVESQYGISNRDRMQFDTRDLCFIACGAFSGLKLTAAAARELGFGRKVAAKLEQKIAVRLETREAEDTESLAKYGFLPELIGRFGRLVVFEPLERDTLREILALEMDRHRKEFALEGFALDIEPKALDAVVESAFQKQTGARGISSALLRAIEDAAYERFGSGETGTIAVGADAEGQPAARFEPGAAPERPAVGKKSKVRYPDLDKDVEPEKAVFEIRVSRKPPKR
ncbi:MAG TPA: AAA family ATPase [Myxococcales bacterium]|jgi:ATP-dependent Clp protease ATP-binding subunit ClpX